MTIGTTRFFGNNSELFSKLNTELQSLQTQAGTGKAELKLANNIGDISILRLDGDWYNSVKICLNKLYEKVIEGGIIIIDDYGHFIGAKNATDEFREENNMYVFF